MNYNDLAWDEASIKALQKADLDEVDTCFSRLETQKNVCKQWGPLLKSLITD